jgi:hypothetical protein
MKQSDIENLTVVYENMNAMRMNIQREGENFNNIIMPLIENIHGTQREDSILNYLQEFPAIVKNLQDIKDTIFDWKNMGKDKRPNTTVESLSVFLRRTQNNLQRVVHMTIQSLREMVSQKKIQNPKISMRVNKLLSQLTQFKSLM